MVKYYQYWVASVATLYFYLIITSEATGTQNNLTVPVLEYRISVLFTTDVEKGKKKTVLHTVSLLGEILEKTFQKNN